jgi:hypothetical protein
VFEKIANIFSQNVGNLASGVFNNQATNAAAAKILNKSPLEIGNSPTTALSNNPYDYGTVYYPSEIANLGTGHYMIFDIVMHQDSKFKNKTFSNNSLVNRSGTGYDGIDDVGQVGENYSTSGKRVEDIKNKNLEKRLVKVDTGIQKQNNTHNHISDSIILYTPPQVKTSYKVNYKNAETGFAGFLGQSEGFIDALVRTGKLGAYAVEAAVVAGLSAVPGVGDIKAVTEKFRGAVQNPNFEMVFESVPFRDFSYTYEFAPKNQKEVDAVQKIIQLFKFHMQPEQAQGTTLNIMGGSSNFLIVPSEFQITYMYLDNINSYIPRISRCVLTSLEVDQSPEGVFTTFGADEKGAFPTLTKMTMTFTETEIMTKKRITEGF